MRFNILKGFADVYPPHIHTWHEIEGIAIKTFRLYGYEEIRLPVVESTDLFSRGIGEGTDIVDKEMYTFQDKGGRSLTLRPEGTASAVRCFVENQLYSMPSPQRFFYSGPMFRYERPQKGRHRQFYQIGCEAFGSEDAALDVEMLLMLHNILKGIGLTSLNIEINSIGCELCRPQYRLELRNFFQTRLSLLCSDCNRRHDSNPLRILDCKVPSCIENRQGAPVIRDFLCNDCAKHFNSLIAYLDSFGLAYSRNDNLVRGLDYYTRTTFEVTTEDLGAQKAVAAGGRYDRLVEQLGGPATPAVGFAMGMERLAALLRDGIVKSTRVMVYIAALGDKAEAESHRIAESIRSSEIPCIANLGRGSLKNQLRKADRHNASYVVILGDEEISAGMISYKDLRTSEMGKCTMESFINKIKS